MQKTSIVIGTVFILLAVVFVTKINSLSSEKTQDTPEEISVEGLGRPTEFDQIEVHPDYQMGVFADLNNPRDLMFTPGGTLIASLMGDNRVVALPDKNHDGEADEVKEIVSDVVIPHGLALHDEMLYVAEEDRVTRYAWDEENLTATFESEFLQLPKGNIGRKDGHYTRTMLIEEDGTMYITLGSSCDACVEDHPWRAAIIKTHVDGREPQVFAKGFRNSVFMAFHPTTGEIWATEMGRNELGDDLPPEEINIIRQGNNYGWPFCYGKQQPDSEMNVNSARECAATTPSLYDLTAHSAPLGLVFIDSPQFPEDWQGDLLVSLHGSFNRSEPSGYQIVRLELDGNKVVGEVPFIDGFLRNFDPESIDGLAPFQSKGRPVDIVFDEQGSMYFSDDYKSRIYKVIKKDYQL